MATPPGFGDISVEMTYTAFPRSSFITFGVDPTDTDPIIVGTKVAESMALVGSVLDLIDNAVTVAAIHVALGTDGGEDLHAVVPRTDSGRSAAVNSPNNCAVLVHKRTARGGRRGRGRLYLPWSVQEAAVDENGVILSSNVTTMQGKCNTWLTDMGTRGVPMVVLHSEGLTAEGPPNSVTSLVVDGIVGTQRRRLGR